ERGIRVASGVAVAPECATSVDELFEVTRRALRANAGGSPTLAPRRRASLLPPPEAPETRGGPVVESRRMKEVFQSVERVAVMPVSVLLLGPTGVGKEV